MLMPNDRAAQMEVDPELTIHMTSEPRTGPSAFAAAVEPDALEPEAKAELMARFGIESEEQWQVRRRAPVCAACGRTRCMLCARPHAVAGDPCARLGVVRASSGGGRNPEPLSS